MKKAIVIEILILIAIFSFVTGVGVFLYDTFCIKPNLYTIVFKDIDGITKGSPVRLMGINIGYVRKLKAVKQAIEVEILVTKKDVKIPQGASARVEFYGLGGSKSIELKPPVEDCGTGIITNNTIRLHDVVSKAKGIVAILEVVEDMLKHVDGWALEKTLKSISTFKNIEINNTIEDFDLKRKEASKKYQEVHQKQEESLIWIKKTNKNVEKVNKFFKK